MAKVCTMVTKAYEICTPIGVYTIHCCNVGIHRLSIDPATSDENFNPNLQYGNDFVFRSFVLIFFQFYLFSDHLICYINCDLYILSFWYVI